MKTFRKIESAKDHCLLGDNAVVAWYDELVQSGMLFADARQKEMVAKLQMLADEIAAPQNDGGFWSRFWNSPKPTAGKCGLYLHGGAGRGKSFLMDGFYLQLRTENKMRAHFHQFMRHLHGDMKKCEENDPLLAVADNISSRFGVVCLDEFHVSDIADAMILGRLVERLTDNGTRLVMTSNYAPADLYPNGLARDRFLPAIAMLQQRLELFALDGGEDYRLRCIAKEGGVFFCEDGGRQMQRLFDGLACGISLPPTIKVNGRRIPAAARSSDAIWFSFAQLCGEALGQGDYLSLAERFAVVMVSDVPPLHDSALSEEARRFTWLVDVLYDKRVTLALDLQTPLDKLYGGGEGGESGRTLSRLVEMQSRDYWGGVLLSPPSAAPIPNTTP